MAKRKSKGKAKGRTEPSSPSPSQPSPPKAASAGSRRSGAGWSWATDKPWATAVFVLAVLAFANSLANGFAYDDLDIIKGNERLEQPWNLPLFFSTSYWGEAAEGANLYRPLTIWSFALDRAFLGSGPFGVHLVNVVLNAALGVFVLAFLIELTGRRDVSIATALLFIVHPVHVEVVANGVGRSELLAAIGLFAAAFLHLRHLQAIGVMPGGRRSRRAKPGSWLAAAMGVFFVALLCKESAAVMPGLLFLAHWLLLARGKLSAVVPHVWRYAAYAAPIAVYFVMRSAVIGSALPAKQEVLGGASELQRVLFASETLLRYVGQLAVPWTLCAEYSDYNNLIRPSLTDPGVLASLVTWLGLGACTIWLLRQRAHLPVFGLAWFFLAILPVSNLIFPIGTIRAERLLFVPSLGFLLAAAWLFGLAFEKGGQARRIAVAILAVVVVLFTVRTVVRNPTWKSNASLWTVTLKQNPGSSVGWYVMGDTHRDRGELAEAEACYRRSFELREGAGFFYPSARNGYASMLSRRGDQAGAAEQYRFVLEKEPRQTTALLNLAALLLHDANTRGEAIELLQRRAEVMPDDFRTYANLAQALKLAGRFDEALQAASMGVTLVEGEPDLWLLKAEIEQRSGRTEDAQRSRARAAQLRSKGN